MQGVLTTAERGFDEDRDGETATGAEDDSELEPDDELQRRLGRALYAACATAVDRLTGRMVTALREAGVLDDSLLVISAARGQALGEHTPIGVEPSLPHAELTHVPLLVRGPNPNWPGVRIRDLVQPAVCGAWCWTGCRPAPLTTAGRPEFDACSTRWTRRQIRRTSLPRSARKWRLPVGAITVG